MNSDLRLRVGDPYQLAQSVVRPITRQFAPEGIAEPPPVISAASLGKAFLLRRTSGW